MCLKCRSVRNSMTQINPCWLGALTPSSVWYHNMCQKCAFKYHFQLLMAIMKEKRIEMLFNSNGNIVLLNLKKSFWCNLIIHAKKDKFCALSLLIGTIFKYTLQHVVWFIMCFILCVTSMRLSGYWYCYLHDLYINQVKVISLDVAQPLQVKVIKPGCSNFLSKLSPFKVIKHGYSSVQFSTRGPFKDLIL